MQFRALIPLVLLTACGALVERHPFQSILPAGQSDAPPPGVHWAVFLDGVLETPRRGVPMRRYEMTVDLQTYQDGPQWEADLHDATVEDDEGHRLPVSLVYVVDGPQPPGQHSYRAEFTVRLPYRFASIGRATVHWRLRAPGHPPVSIKSVFQN